MKLFVTGKFYCMRTVDSSLWLMPNAFPLRTACAGHNHTNDFVVQLYGYQVPRLLGISYYLPFSISLLSEERHFLNNIKIPRLLLKTIFEIFPATDYYYHCEKCFLANMMKFRRTIKNSTLNHSKKSYQFNAFRNSRLYVSN